MSNYVQIRQMDITNGEGIGISVFFSGCHFHCKNCFNHELWDPEYGTPFTKDSIEVILHLMKPNHISRLSILGGEPLDGNNYDTVLNLVKIVKSAYPKKKIWLYTGNTYENIKDLDILEYIDYLVDGQYIDSLKDMNLRFRGSSNQRVIDVQKSLDNKETVLYDLGEGK